MVESFSGKETGIIMSGTIAIRSGVTQFMDFFMIKVVTSYVYYCTGPQNSYFDKRSSDKVWIKNWPWSQEIIRRRSHWSLKIFVKILSFYQGSG